MGVAHRDRARIPLFRRIPRFARSLDGTASSAPTRAAMHVAMGHQSRSSDESLAPLGLWRDDVFRRHAMRVAHRDGARHASTEAVFLCDAMVIRYPDPDWAEILVVREQSRSSRAAATGDRF